MKTRGSQVRSRSPVKNERQDSKSGEQFQGILWSRVE